MNSFLRNAGVSLCLALVPLSTASAEPLEAAVRASLTSAKIEKARVGVAIMDCESREPLATINANELFAPASNLKLITSGVALTILKDFEFRTAFSASDGRLIIKGAGDPALCDPKLLDQQGWSVERFLTRIVDAARAAGVTGIREVIVDDRVFERDSNGAPTVHPSWPKDQLNQWYCAPVSGLNFFTNVLELRAKPADRAGLKPDVTTEPSAPWLLNLDLSSTRTVKEGASSLWAQQDRNGGNSPSAAFSFKVYGDVRDAARQAPNVVSVTVSQPGLFFAGLLFHEMWKAGLTTGWNGGSVPPVRVAADGEELASAEATPFAVITTPLATAMKRCNVQSQNLYAECLLKRTAYEVTQQPGSWATGSQIVTMRLTEKLGQDAQGLRIVDGSGLSKDNQVSPMIMVKWLTTMQQDRALGETFLASMARADRDDKFIKRFADRKLGSIVYAKTGLIKNSRCLSGYVVRGDHAVAYSVLVNDTGGAPAQRINDFQEEVVVSIDRWLARNGGIAEKN